MNGFLQLLEVPLKVKINEDYVLRSVGKKYIAVPIGEESERFHGVIRLNSTGKFIWESISAGDSENVTVSKMVDKYDISEEHARVSYRNSVEQLTDLGILLA